MIAVGISLAIIALLKMEEKSYGLVLVIVLGGFAAYNYLKSDLGLRYKIPLSKITNIEFDEEETIVSFINGDGNKCYETLIKLEDKGKDFLREKFN